MLALTPSARSNYFASQKSFAEFAFENPRQEKIGYRDFASRSYPIKTELSENQWLKWTQFTCRIAKQDRFETKIDLLE